MSRQIPDDLLAVIQGLAAKTTDNGCTEAEAESAARMLRKLLMRHQLSMFDVASSTLEEECTSENFDSEYEKMPAWQVTLALRIAEGFSCKVLFGQYLDITSKWAKQFGMRYRVRLIFVGVESDAQVACYFYPYLMDYLLKACEDKIAEHRIAGSYKTTYRDSFIKAAADTIKTRLLADIQEAIQIEGEHSKTGALVVVKHDLVASYYKQEYPDTQKFGYNSGKRSKLGVQDGKIAGQQANLSRPLGNSQSISGYLS